MDLSRPAVMGITTPGKRTVFFRGSIGTCSGRASLLSCSSSSEVISGINSASDSISWGDKLSKERNFDLNIESY